ncbi:DUF4097 domain-containing protein [Plantactinospora sp. GCM10030261]|uniref:DUF4097 family beta strand repeat-containing protein n=1 Tax=Plantactinospora sp. GCM10030261 TaxID=3273420 RepID=UPI0036171BC1
MSTPRLATAGSAALALIALAGCAQLSEKRLEFSRTEQSRVDTVVIEPGAGDVVIRTGQVTEVAIKRVVRYHGEAPPGTTYRVDGPTLVLDTDCGRRCVVSYDVTLPTGVPVRGENGSGDMELSRMREVDVKLGSGDLTITDVAGPVRGEVGSGSITVTGGEGEVRLTAGSGDISGRGLGAGAVHAETGSGDINLDLDTASSVTANADSGSVELAVATGRYQVAVSTGSGSRTVQVADDPTASLRLDVRTGSGDVTIKSSGQG